MEACAQVAMWGAESSERGQGGTEPVADRRGSWPAGGDAAALTGSLLPSSLHGVAFFSLRPGAQSCPVSSHSELLTSPMNGKNKTGSSFLASPGWPRGYLKLGQNKLALSEHCIMYLSLFYRHA